MHAPHFFVDQLHVGLHFMTVYLCTHQTRKSVDKTSLAYNLYQIAECLDGHRSLEEEISYVMSVQLTFNATHNNQ